MAHFGIFFVVSVSFYYILFPASLLHGLFVFLLYLSRLFFIYVGQEALSTAKAITLNLVMQK
jgi:hypothetical protein